MSTLRKRPAARVIVVDPNGYVLLFHFMIKTGVFAGLEYWSLPGGAVEEGESYAEAACRELFEETGLRVDSVGNEVASPHYKLPLARGEMVLSDERLFVLPVPARPDLSRDGLTETEKKVMAEAKWWLPAEMRTTSDIIYPPGLAEIAEQFR